MSSHGHDSDNREPRALAQGVGGGWRRLRGWGMAGGTSGARPGANGAHSGAGREALRSYWRGLATISALVLLFNAVNVTSNLHDMPGVDPAEPVIWEATSWVTFTLFAFIPWLALRAAPLSGWMRPRVLLHAPALLAFSFLHVAGFIVLRKAVYGLFGAHYGTGVFTQFWYEFRKDILGYLLAIAAFHWSAQRHPAHRPASPAPTSFDIRDGAAVIRVPFGNILAVSAAGNYVEFLLADGRRPLMRSPLSALESELSAAGFVRTHRSWLVNPAAMTGLMPQGSGDYIVTLGAVTVPVSRRYRAALARLREG